MREIICLHTGQAGIQLSNAAWELLCIEHGIQASGKKCEHLLDDESVAFHTFFRESPHGNYTPRCVSIDTEPTVMDEVRTGIYRNLFSPEQMINGIEDAANNYARGRYTIGRVMIGDIMDRVRKQVEYCDHPIGFFKFNSVGGGTGSGLGTLISQELAVEYSKKFKFQLTIYPGKCTQSSVVEPYNTMMTTEVTINCTDFAAIAENEAVYEICKNRLNAVHPSFTNLNRVISQVFSSLTCSYRYESTLNSDLNQLSTNLIPYPRLHFIIFGHAPIDQEVNLSHDCLTATQLTRQVYEPMNLFSHSHLLKGIFMSCCLQYRGDITPREVNDAVMITKSRPDIRFVDWCPTGFKVGLNSQAPVAVPGSGMAQTFRSVSLICNSTAIADTWSDLISKFDLLFKKKAFVHWYVGEGMEESEFNEARDECTLTTDDYEMIKKDQMKEGDKASKSSNIDTLIEENEVPLTACSYTNHKFPRKASTQSAYLCDQTLLDTNEIPLTACSYTNHKFPRKASTQYLCDFKRVVLSEETSTGYQSTPSTQNQGFSTNLENEFTIKSVESSSRAVQQPARLRLLTNE